MSVSHDVTPAFLPVLPNCSQIGMCRCHSPAPPEQSAFRTCAPPEDEYVQGSVRLTLRRPRSNSRTGSPRTMKLSRLPLVIAVLAGLPALAQPGQGEVPSTQSEYSAPRMSLEQVEQLLAPIALYPDALIALILPASTVPTDIVLAARQLRDTPNDRSQIEHRSWDESVKSLTHYPEVLLWLDENLPWTKQVGEAFLAQPAEVMQSIQKLRNQARAAGTLVDTPEQQIVTEANIVRIVPAQPDVIYVPRYEPDVVFLPQPVYSRSFVTFGLGVGVGSWLAYDCDWNRNTLWMASRHRPWIRPDWRRPFLSSAPHFTHAPIVYQPIVRAWRPPVTHASRPPTYGYHRSGTVIRPTPFGYSRSQPASPPVARVYGPPVPAARSYSAPSRSLTYSQSHSHGRAEAQTGSRPESHAAGRTYARNPSSTVGAQFADAVAPAPVPVAPPVAAAITNRPSSGRSHPGSRSRNSGAPDQSSRQRTFERSAPPSAPQAAMGPMPAARSSSNPTLSLPAAEPASARRFNRTQPAPAPAAAAVAPAPTVAPAPAAAPANPQPGHSSGRGRSGGENSNTAPRSGSGYGNRVGR